MIAVGTSENHNVIRLSLLMRVKATGIAGASRDSPQGPEACRDGVEDGGEDRVYLKVAGPST